jgi:predicted small lipoprotein YifL
MLRSLIAAAAVLALAACNQGSGPDLPKTQEGAQAPSQQTASTAQQATITDEVRQQLIQNIGDQLSQFQSQAAPNAPRAEGLVDEIIPLQPGTDHRWQVNLTGGTAYTILGACDGDCTNVDIELIDVRTGGVVASDVLPDDYPLVTYTPAANGQHIVRIMMQTCTVAPCYAGARVLTTTGGGK